MYIMVIIVQSVQPKYQYYYFVIRLIHSGTRYKYILNVRRLDSVYDIKLI